jgi:hypothetical protein
MLALHGLVHAQDLDTAEELARRQVDPSGVSAQAVNDTSPTKRSVVLRHNSIPTRFGVRRSPRWLDRRVVGSVVGHRGVIERITTTRGAVLPDRW